MLRPLVLLLLPGCVVLEIHEGNGVAATDTREVPAFTNISSESVVDVELLPGDGGTAVVSCDENLVDHIETSVASGTLVIRVLQDKDHPVEILPNIRCVVQVAADEIETLSASGAGGVTVSGEDRALSNLITSGSGDVFAEVGLNAPSLTVVTTGSGEVVLSSVTADLVELTTSGSGSIQVAQGGANDLGLVATGSGDILLRGLSAISIDAVLSGSGDAEVTAVQRLSATLSGSGDLTVWGDPGEREVVTTGSGEVLDGE